MPWLATAAQSSIVPARHDAVSGGLLSAASPSESDFNKSAKRPPPRSHANSVPERPHPAPPRDHLKSVGVERAADERARVRILEPRVVIHASGTLFYPGADSAQLLLHRARSRGQVIDPGDVRLALRGEPRQDQRDPARRSVAMTGAPFSLSDPVTVAMPPCTSSRHPMRISSGACMKRLPRSAPRATSAVGKAQQRTSSAPADRSGTGERGPSRRPPADPAFLRRHSCEPALVCSTVSPVARGVPRGFDEINSPAKQGHIAAGDGGSM